MGSYKEISNTLKQEYKSRSGPYKERLIEWSASPTVSRVQKPTNLPRARSLGYKAIEGVVVARVRVRKGKRKRAQAGGGRKPSKSGKFFSRAKSLQAIAEEKAARKFDNCEVLNSYFVGATGSEEFYEVIMLDRASRRVSKDPLYKSVITHKGRAFRGLSASGRRHRGL